MADESGSYGRSALERLLGAGSFYFTDSSGAGRKGRMRWDCGCAAEETAPDRFNLTSCERHEPAPHKPA